VNGSLEFWQKLCGNILLFQKFVYSPSISFPNIVTTTHEFFVSILKLIPQITHTMPSFPLNPYALFAFAYTGGITVRVVAVVVKGIIIRYFTGPGFSRQYKG